MTQDLATRSGPGSAEPGDRERLRVAFDAARIDEIFQAFASDDQPGLAVGIAVDGQAVYRKGFGRASVELPVPISPTIRMRIGSTTKHFAALAYLLLCEAGRASLDDEIGRHIPELAPENRHATVRQLLGHTSGIRDAFDYTMQLQGTNLRVTEAEMLAFYRASEGVNAQPQTHWSYKNGGYMLAAIAVERLADRPLEDVLKNSILDPIGMRDTCLRRWDTDFLPNSAALHLRKPDGGWTQHYMGMELGAAGGLVSTVDDMLLWLRHMDAPFVGAPESWAAMRTPQRLENGASTGYGLGLASETYRGVATLSHSGGVISGNSQMIKVPAAGLDITIAANRSDVSTVALARRVVDACLPDLSPATATGSGDVPEGAFLSSDTGRVIELSRLGERALMALDAFELPVERHADDILRLAGDLASEHLEVRLLEGGRAGLIFHNYGHADVLYPIAREPSARLPFERATFQSRGGNFTARIVQAGDGARLETVGPQGGWTFRLEPIAKRVWKALSGVSPFRAAALTFSPDADSFSLTAARTRAWNFERTS